MSLTLLAATTTCSTTRPSMANNGRNPATAPAVLTNVPCTYPVPAQADLLQAMITQTVSQRYESFLVGLHDVRAGDWLTVDGTNYLVIVAAPWPINGLNHTHVTLEKILQ